MTQTDSTPKPPAEVPANVAAASDSAPAATATVLRLWVRPEPKVRPVEVDALELIAGEGIAGDHTRGRMRHVTLLFEDDWERAAHEIGRDRGEVDPAGRRANVLLSGSDAGEWIGKTIALGPARIRIRGVTAPCPTMEKAARGMMNALKPAARSGVWGRVIEGGVVRCGDLARMLSTAESGE